MLGYHKNATLANGVITAKVEARTATYFLFVTAATNRRSTTGCSQTIQIQYTCRELRSLEVRANASDPAHDFSVKLSPSMCAIAAARNLTACNLWHPPLVRTLASYVRIMHHQVWHITANNRQWQSCFVPWKNRTSAVCCLLRLTPWCWIIWLVFLF